MSSDEEKQETLSGRSQGSLQDSDEDFNTSDDEPLSKYVSPKVNENDEESGLTSSDPDSDGMNVEQPPKNAKLEGPRVV